MPTGISLLRQCWRILFETLRSSSTRRVNHSQSALAETLVYITKAAKNWLDYINLISPTILRICGGLSIGFSSQSRVTQAEEFAAETNLCDIIVDRRISH